MKIKALLVMLVFLFAAAFLAGTPNPALSKDKPIELSYSNFLPAGYGATTPIKEWAEEIEKRTEGRVKITIYHGGTLTSARDCYEGVVMGTSDIGHSVLAYTRGRFPLMEAIDLPGYPFNAVVPSRIADDIYRKFKPKELADTHVLYMHTHIPGVILTRDKPVRKLEDLKGLRIRSTGLSSKIVEALGGIPVAMPKGDQYDALLKGVVDGTTGSPNELKGWRTAEVSKYSTVYDKLGYVSGFFIVMNLEKWNSLPKDIQNIFTEVSKGWAEYTGKNWNKMEIEGIAYGKTKGHTFIFLPPEEGKRWEEAVKPLYDNYVKNMEAKGLPGKEVLEYRQKLIEKYTKMYPSLKFE